MATIAIYPGTFDPVTNGHLDLMKRGLSLFDNLIVAVALNPAKNPLFPAEERVEFIRETTHGWKNFTVESFDNLLINFINKRNGRVIIKGLRAISDFEYELQLSSMNRKLDSSIETVFMAPSDEYLFLSSKMIKEIFSLGGNVETMVPEPVIKGLERRFDL